MRAGAARTETDMHTLAAWGGDTKQLYTVIQAYIELSLYSGKGRSNITEHISKLGRWGALLTEHSTTAATFMLASGFLAPILCGALAAGAPGPLGRGSVQERQDAASRHTHVKHFFC